MYEYVKEAEYAPIKKEIEEILRRVQAEMQEKHGLAFQFQLIGSGQNHLVTRIRGGNGGYDFDYNLIVPTPQNGHGYEADTVKRDFMAAFQTALKGTGYSFPKDSTSAITIKTVDKGNKKIQYGCDFAIIYYGKNGENSGYYYLRNNKKKNLYEFVFRPLKSGIEEKANAILAHNGWEQVREQYLKLKNINEGRKKRSFSIYIEAVHNVFNHMFKQANRH